MTRIGGIAREQQPKGRKVALGRSRKKSCRPLIPGSGSVDGGRVERNSPGPPRRAPRLWRRRPAFGLRYALAGVTAAWALIAGALWMSGNDFSPSRWPGLITAPPVDQVVA